MFPKKNKIETWCDFAKIYRNTVLLINCVCVCVHVVGWICGIENGLYVTKWWNFLFYYFFGQIQFVVLSRSINFGLVLVLTVGNDCIRSESLDRDNNFDIFQLKDINVRWTFFPDFLELICSCWFPHHTRTLVCMWRSSFREGVKCWTGVSVL